MFPDALAPIRRDHRGIGDTPSSRDALYQLLADRRRARLEHLARSIGPRRAGWCAPEETVVEPEATVRDVLVARGSKGCEVAGATRGTRARGRSPRGEHFGPARLLGAPRHPGPLRRDLSDRVVGGVAAGVSHKTGIDPALVRAAFVVSSITGGLGVAAYVLAWLFIPAEGEDKAAASRATGDRRGIGLALATVPLLVLTLAVASAFGASWMKTVAWPLFLAAGGLVLVWRNVSDAERSLIQQSFGPMAAPGVSGPRSQRWLVTRVGASLLLGLTGAVTLTRGRPSRGVLEPLVGLVLVAFAVVVAFGPFWVRIVRDLVEERQARARAEERSDIATRIHDSVLQTLALIQRQAHDPHQVVALARAQERELRAWLFEGRVPGSLDGAATLGAALERLQLEVESLFGVPVEAVVVGDCELDDNLISLLEATREATVNAAKWSGAAEVSVFAEVDTDMVAIYVRDRGKGFDESAVAADRRGLAESIRGRMTRHGGQVALRSRLGEGTEVTLRMPRP